MAFAVPMEALMASKKGRGVISDAGRGEPGENSRRVPDVPKFRKQGKESAVLLIWSPTRGPRQSPVILSVPIQRRMRDSSSFFSVLDMLASDRHKRCRFFSVGKK